MSNEATAVIIVAAGQGKRMGANKNKVLLPLYLKPIIAWTLEGFIQVGQEIGSIVLVAHKDDLAYLQGLIDGNGWANRVELVEGGSERIDSVQRGLEALEGKGYQWVAVHDGARPLFTPSLIARCIEKAKLKGSAVASVPVKDTIKEASSEGVVTRTPDRKGLYAIQTPQIFSYPELVQAYKKLEEIKNTSEVIPTDDAMVMEWAGHSVFLALGDYENIKITTPEDLLIAEAILQKRHDLVGADRRISKENRVGLGYDVHRLVAGRDLILGGVHIPYEKGLLGHSDADVLLHAIKDAILGAAGLGDIGRHFPDSDETYKGISSLLLLQKVAQIVEKEQWQIQNIDATVVAQRPKLAPYIAEMVKNISEALGIKEGQVNIKATTTEGLGFAGTGEGMAAYATVLLQNR
ncbi:2-C-methyl-D-erythritol 4-phosphate cytidylyltransferase [Heliorestis convoluta]|uniref:Bifunctional enzyme IspD/IspF n=1 Tax=Heliorestis convoluta TaxID=356322 RepID=A0A5Q2NAB1_9FIRM|nr:2-C-methyl-D-erythritol 4-phosphate cytidylyltransferase [Heliorestis convoluta]QGG49210.1 Bifunctional enzyme IspD/IspF [Heliorestis convoluta]